MKKCFLICFMLIPTLICAQGSSTELNARLDVTGDLTVGNAGLWLKPSKRPDIKGDIYLFKGWNNIASIITGQGEKYKLKNINFDTNQKMFATKAAIDSVFVFSRESIKQVMVNNKMFKRYSKDFVYDYYEVIAFGKGKEVLKQSVKEIKKGAKDPFTNSLKSDEYVLKSKYLSNILELYNKEILSESKKLVNNVQKYIIPNNNNKYYLLIVNKNDITPNNVNTKYKIFYFFPDTAQQEQTHILNTLNKNSKSDFYVEIDNYKTSFSNSNYLFEGYLYKSNDKKHFLITDVLAVDSKIIKCDYSLRYALIHKLIANQQLNNLNGHLNINIHSIFELNAESYDNEIQTSQIFTMFKNNFIFKEEI